MKYNIYNPKDKRYWCENRNHKDRILINQERTCVGFWSNFDSSKKDRVSYNMIIGYIMLLVMRLCNKDLNEAKLVGVFGD